ADRRASRDPRPCRRRGADRGDRGRGASPRCARRHAPAGAAGGVHGAERQAARRIDRALREDARAVPDRRGRAAVRARVRSRRAPYVRDRVRLRAPHPAEEPAGGEIHDALREHLLAHGASFWTDLFASSGVADQRAVLNALWDLVWAGEATNDTLAPLRSAVARKTAPSRSAKPRPAKPQIGALRRAGPPAAAGRWSLVAPLLQPETTPTEI